jgi:hypothetical protein
MEFIIMVKNGFQDQNYLKVIILVVVNDDDFSDYWNFNLFMVGDDFLILFINYFIDILLYFVKKIILIRNRLILYLFHHYNYHLNFLQFLKYFLLLLLKFIFGYKVNYFYNDRE